MSTAGYELHSRFRSQFGVESTSEVFAPGRINLIGEHIDYCGGQVLPITIQYGTWCVGALNSTGNLRIASTRFDEIVEQDLRRLRRDKRNNWANYPIGVINSYLHAGAKTAGLDLLFGSDLPGGGLSSSASFTVATALLIQSLTGYSFSNDWRTARWKIAKLCQLVENEYIGVNCGIMDPAVVALAKGRNALRIDCSKSSNEFHEIEYIPADTGPYRIVIMNSGKQRKLAASAYNRRVAEIQQIHDLLNGHMEFSQLCDLGEDDLPMVRQLIANEILQKRCSHVVSENQRVADAAHALRSGELNRFGELMYLSHKSLSEDYEVTGDELNELVSASMMQDGVLGARMTGAGFGGCAISLVHTDAIAVHNNRVRERYTARCKYQPEFYTVKIGSSCLD
jgi:galactokinase